MNLITRSDFDGLTCAVLLKEVEIIEKTSFGGDERVGEADFVFLDARLDFFRVAQF